MPSENISPYSIRNYRPADFKKYVRFIREAESLEPVGRPVSPRNIVGRLSHPNYSPEHDMFVGELSGSIVGYLDIMPELAIGRVILECWVHPEHRRKGLATQLLDFAIHQGRETSAVVAHVNIFEDNTVGRIVLQRLGFNYVRDFLEFELDLAEIDKLPVDKETPQCRCLRRDETDILTEIQNLSFAEHWGYNPNTTATTTHHFNQGRSSPEDVFLAFEGNRVTGFCWTEETSPGEGRIFMLGVAPDCRCQGTGRSLLQTGLYHLKSKGLRTAVLTVDSENISACELYRSAGFKLRTCRHWYEKTLGQDT